MSRTPLLGWLRRTLRQASPHPLHPYAVKKFPQKIPLIPEESTAGLHLSISRRAFLQTLAGGAIAAAGLGLAPGAAAGAQRLRSSGAENPVVVVGGGLGGLVSAYRLMRAGIPCALYEASARLGGRVHTRENFNPDGMFVELGGELVDTGHEELIALCAELNVPLERFPVNEPGIEPALYFSGGQVYTESAVLAAFEPFAETLRADILRCFPEGEVQVPTYQQPFNAAWLDRMSLQDYLDRQTQVPDWLRRLIATAYIGEYGLRCAEQSALNLLVLIGAETDTSFRMFGESDEAMRIRGGNSRLVNALVQALQGRTPIHCQRPLRRLDALPDGSGLWLQFEDMPPLLAERALLALPFSVLRTVQGLAALPLSERKRQCIAEWGYGTNSKQMIGFRERFWRAPEGGTPAATGELFTDLPSQCYWDTSRLQAGERGILTNFLGGAAGAAAQSDQWQAALLDLQRLYPHIHADTDGCTAFANWRKNPWSLGSYTCPRPGQYTTLMGAAQEPELNGRLFFAGEHCSVDWSGFMNGAVQSGNAAARQLATAIPARAAVLSPL